MTAGALSRWLLAAASVAALVGVAALAWPARVDVAPRRPALAAVPNAVAADAAPDDSALVAAVVQANVFSDTRRPPATRYDPSGTADDVGVAAPEVSPPPPAAPADSDDAPDAASPVPRLFGIVADPQGAAALLRLDPRLPGARAYHVGDRGGAYRVVRVGAEDVVLDGPGGRRTLRLARSPR